MIIVTGANGQLGRAVVERLLSRVPAAQLGVSVRDPEQTQDLARQGVRVRRGDYDDAASLADAFEGASRVLLVSVNSTSEAAVRQHRTAINAAKAVGAERIFYTSHVGANPTSAFLPMRDHAATEATLREAGVAFTSLRNGFYAQTAASLISAALQTDTLTAPQDGPIDYTTHADLAEAIAICLTNAGLNDEILNLTGAEASDTARLAAIASEVTGRPIRHAVVSDDEYRAHLLAQGLPAPQADTFLGLFVASRQGQFRLVDPTLARLIGRPPAPVRVVVQEAVSSAS